MQNAIDFYNSHHAAFTAVMLAMLHLAHLAWPRVQRTFFFCRDNGGAYSLIAEFWKGRPDPAGQAALIASQKQTIQPAEAGTPNNNENKSS